ncbi:unnamed protein product [Rotaria socialis]|uniref:Uncharacterized protein n=1 Tax=Rotaria socialis TaxID=392032 RepID=A0A818DGY0_9BILA|nr:unnamed protein product [Rotaria socialis]CAF3475143.1 unnamed protein product [Rotaria socialis]CAF3722833.1 unnamed protein product [Rotaria socialis]CAF4152180.1 unnamed protein product [Rotaria socialis]CAF4629699.1 unnamed protein product [Rotaria socialis]
MAAIDEPTVSPRQFHHRRFANLQPLSPRVPSSIERHFEQYLIDHHHYPKLPSISKKPNRQSLENSCTSDQDLLSYHDRQVSSEFGQNTGPISRLISTEQYRRAQSRLVEYRQHSKIPGVTLPGTKNSNEKSPINLIGRTDLKIPLKEVLPDTTRGKQFYQQDEFDFVDDDSVASNGTDRRRRAKHWIKDHQFFFTEYQ